MSVARILCPKCGYPLCYCKCAPNPDWAETERECLVADLKGSRIERGTEWAWLARPPWWRPFKRRDYDREIAKGIGYFSARLAAFKRPPGVPEGPCILYRRPTLWQRLKFKFPGDRETKKEETE